MPKNKRAARKKKKNKKKKNIKSSVSNPLAEKVIAEAEAVSNPGEKFSRDPTAMANSVLSGRVVNGDEMSLESALEGLSLRQQVRPLHEHLNERATIPHAAAEKTAADAKLSEIVASNVLMSGSVSNAFESDMIAVGDVNTQPVSELTPNENEGNESSDSADNQNTLQEILTEASTNKIEKNKTCESVVNDEVKLQESLIKTSKKAGRNEPLESVDHQISLDKSLTGSTSDETEKNELPILVDRLNFLQESLIKSTSNETEGNEGGNVGKSSMTPSSTIPPAVETNEASGSVITDELVLEETIAETVIEEPLVEPKRPQRNTNLPSHFNGFYMSPLVKPKRKPKRK